MSIATALVRASSLVNAVCAETAREYGITARQGQLLCVLTPRPYGTAGPGPMPGPARSSLTGLVDRTAQDAPARPAGACGSPARAAPNRRSTRWPSRCRCGSACSAGANHGMISSTGSTMMFCLSGRTAG
jgi:hypothetical protein